ncbi:RES family NAD+ phosphorylase [Sphingobium limneticum]|uniref:RES family NAD+ phosphorylase n=1 Tax=Sphingobium limneticum TaxID=1007511 RepID=UPI001B8739F2|nr:RES domain-containing protein [Sphingobium limneticum]
MAGACDGRTDRILSAYRIGDLDGVHPIYDSEGARLYPGRWNMPASPIICTSEHYSTAMLEKLAHASSVLPPNQHYVRITIPTAPTTKSFRPPPIRDGTGRMRGCERR